MSTSVLPCHMRRAASISHSITPTAKMSARRSTGRALQLLGRHVRELALERAGRVWCDAAARLRDAEVDQLHRARRR